MSVCVCARARANGKVSLLACAGVGLVNLRPNEV